MSAEQISQEECADLLAVATEMRDDSMIGQGPGAFQGVGLLRKHRGASARMVCFAGRTGYLSEGQVNYLGDMAETYRRIKNLNEGVGDGYRSETVRLLDETLEQGMEHKGKSLQNRRAIVRARTQQIRDGEYFWDDHVRPARELLGALQKKDVDVSDLKERVDARVRELSYQ